MPRLALVNFIVGFAAIFTAACGGLFLAVDQAQAFLHDRSIIASWLYTVSASAHGHTNLFGMLHIVFGLTLPYSALPARGKQLQSLGLGLGTLAMSVLLIVRGYLGPSSSFDGLGVLIGACLSAALIALGSHCWGLLGKLRR